MSTALKNDMIKVGEKAFVLFYGQDKLFFVLGLQTLNVGPPVHGLFVHSDVKELLFATIADKQSGECQDFKIIQKFEDNSK